MTRSTVYATAPSHWACYLINGDDSALDEDEKAAADAFVEWLGGWPCDCEDAGFRWNHDASQFMPLGADCQRYAAQVRA